MSRPKPAPRHDRGRVSFPERPVAPPREEDFGDDELENVETKPGDHETKGPDHETPAADHGTPTDDYHPRFPEIAVELPDPPATELPNETTAPDPAGPPHVEPPQPPAVASGPVKPLRVLVADEATLLEFMGL